MLEVSQATGGINQLRRPMQRQGDGVDAVIPALQIRLEACTVLSGDVHGPAPHHQTGHVPLLVEHHATAPQPIGQGARQGEGSAGDHKIKIRLGLEPSQQGITNRSPHQNRPRRQKIQGKGPALGCQALQNGGSR